MTPLIFQIAIPQRLAILRELILQFNCSIIHSVISDDTISNQGQVLKVCSKVFWELKSFIIYQELQSIVIGTQSCLTGITSLPWVQLPRATKPGKPQGTVGMGIIQCAVGQHCCTSTHTLIAATGTSAPLRGEPCSIWPWHPDSTGGYLQ